MFFLDILLSFVSSVILIICVLVSVAFLTLLERKVLGYIQVRKGPNKVGVVGILQPFSDAVKLFSKEQTYPLFSNFLIYFLSPVVSLFLSLLVWIVLPLGVTCNSFSLGVLFFLGCISMGVYSIAIAGWSSNSNYAVLGGLRAVAQTISYEVSLVFIILSLILLTGSLDFSFFLSYQKYVPFCLFLFPLCFIWFIVMLAETNRTPFDLAEGESELVSGFNVEYSSGGFAMIFLAEYSSILFMSVLFCIMFFSSWMFSISFYMLVVLISFLFIWSRATLPRVRYDKLMGLTWKCFLPFSLNFLLMIIGVKIMLFYFILWT